MDYLHILLFLKFQKNILRNGEKNSKIKVLLHNSWGFRVSINGKDKKEKCTHASPCVAAQA